MKIGVLGLGARGQSLIKNAILPALQEYNMEIAAIYDPYADRVQRASKLIFKKTGKHPIEAKDQHEVLPKSRKFRESSSHPAGKLISNWLWKR